MNRRMNIKDAIEILSKHTVDMGKKSKQYAEAIKMAIVAIEKQNADGCVGCKYEHKDEYEMPCLMCKRNKVDYWQRGDDDEH